MGRLLTLGLLAVVVLETGWLVYPHVRERLAPSELTAAVRGERLAQDLGCFGCHGPGGGGGVANPTRSTDGNTNQRTIGGDDEVPPFTEQTQMMYVKTTDDLRQYILDGAPRRKLDDPEYKAKMASAALRMPAYRGKVTPEQVEDLVAYLRATSGQIIPEEKLAEKGAELALEFDCHACHGPLGAGGLSNPGSFKGYIPGFWGADFDELVADDTELRTWIHDGKIARIAEHPVGRHFFEGQALQMPAYGQFLQPADVDALVAWVRWVRNGAWRDKLN